MYLQKWATMLDVPILSIDYNLAPQAPYPRALEEIVYAYAWALKHASTLLGSTAKKVVFAGDSAGGTLNLGAILKCLQLNIKKPDGIFMAYAPVFINYILSPSHMLFSIDTLLLLGVIVRCLKAYGSDNETLAKEHEDKKGATSNIESPAEVSKNDLAASIPNEDSVSDCSIKLTSPTSDSTLNPVESIEVDEQNDKLCSWLKSFHRRNNKKGNQLDETNANTLSKEIVTLISKDPFLSPYIASDDMLAHLPPIKILALQLDPCLDDCVMFARKLRSLGNKVTLDILPDLPHGFLYFSRVKLFLLFISILSIIYFYYFYYLFLLFIFIMSIIYFYYFYYLFLLFIFIMSIIYFYYFYYLFLLFIFIMSIIYFYYFYYLFLLFIYIYVYIYMYIYMCVCVCINLK
ncbi:Hormone-sensitive lipase [Camponotus floridanus]|uniref:Hormone-sensitive lipase n=1 Tax=Camponotus floridanus TaxID=104421 RepID=E2B1H6_CAMFO|nr:Hormone-sensitive lipase [Camponotus floridanus]